MSHAGDDGHAVSAIAPRWRILLVEDCADDAELVRIELAHGGIDADLRCVDNEAQLRDALRSFTPQLVVSDMNMPGFCGRQAMELVREHAPGARFVFLSGDRVDRAQAADGPRAPDARLSKDHIEQLPALVRTLLG